MLQIVPSKIPPAPDYDLRRPRISVTNHGVAINQALVALDFEPYSSGKGYYLVYPENFENNEIFNPLLDAFLA